jgi:5'-3' exonuclease
VPVTCICSYAPLVSALTDLSGLTIRFTLGEPFRPLQQLLSVLPPASAYLVPRRYRPLMTSEHSPIKDFYPTKFEGLCPNACFQSFTTTLSTYFCCMF